MPLTERGKAALANGPKPRQEADWEFRKAMAYELVFAWQDADASVKPSLERVMCNVGLDFDGNDWSFAMQHGRLYIQGAR